MSAQRLKELIQQGWDALIKPSHVIWFEETLDSEGRSCLLISLNGTTDWLTLCPISDDWATIEGHASWIESDDHWHLWMNHDTFERDTIDIIWMLGTRILWAELGLD